MQRRIDGWKWFCGTVLVVGAALPAEARLQGSMGPSSRGTIGISVSIAESARLSPLGDVAIADLESGPTVTRFRPFCLWSSSARSYKITAHGSGASGAFTLGNPALPALPYGVRWRGGPMKAFVPIVIETKRLASARPKQAANGCADTIALAFQTPPRHVVGNAKYIGLLTIIAAPE